MSNHPTGKSTDELTSNETKSLAGGAASEPSISVSESANPDENVSEVEISNREDALENDQFGPSNTTIPSPPPEEANPTSAPSGALLAMPIIAVGQKGDVGDGSDDSSGAKNIAPAPGTQAENDPGWTPAPTEARHLHELAHALDTQDIEELADEDLTPDSGRESIELVDGGSSVSGFAPTPNSGSGSVSGLPGVPPPPPPRSPGASQTDLATPKPMRVGAAQGDFQPTRSRPSESLKSAMRGGQTSSTETEDTVSIDMEDVEENDVPTNDEGQSGSKPKPPPPAPSPTSIREKAEALKAPKPAPAPKLSTFKSATGEGKKRRPWWEDIFDDDCIRSIKNPTDPQIRAEVKFIEERLGLAEGALILDLACGNGRHAVNLTKRGYQVVGFDLSLAMLARASDEAEAENQRINFLQGDMRDMSFDTMFDGVYCWGTSFGYFDEEKNASVVQRVYKALRPGGVFLLDVYNRDYIACRQPSMVWFEGDGCICMDEAQVDFITSRLKVKRTVMIEDGRTREIEYSIRLYGLHELGKLLHSVGFKVLEVSGQTATPGVFFGSESPRCIVVAEKSENA
jgi:SAM-dependent methyltransferase